MNRTRVAEVWSIPAEPAECGGRYYLPYRLHATGGQFDKAYPHARAWFERKRYYDPDEVFQNRFYAKYGGQRDSDGSLRAVR